MKIDPISIVLFFNIVHISYDTLVDAIILVENKIHKETKSCKFVYITRTNDDIDDMKETHYLTLA
jgi:hypothetical protein